MGQKSSPLSLRTQNNYQIWSHCSDYPKVFLIRNHIINFFYTKGFLINKLSLKINNNTTLYVDVEYIISKTSTLYTKKFRKSLKKKKPNKFNKSKNLPLNYFLKTLSTILKIKKIHLVIKRLDVKLNKKILNLILLQSYKIGLKRYLRTQYIKDLILITSLLLENSRSIESQLVNYVLAKYFTWLPKRQHKRFFIFLRNFFKLLYIMDKHITNTLEGIKLLVSGKISGKTQASNFRSIVGSIFSQSITKNVDYNKNISYSRLGTFGWQLWIAKK